MKSLINTVRSFVESRPWTALATSTVPLMIFITLAAVLPAKEWYASLEGTAQYDIVSIALTLVTFLCAAPIIYTFIQAMETRVMPVWMSLFPKQNEQYQRWRRI